MMTSLSAGSGTTLTLLGTAAGPVLHTHRRGISSSLTVDGTVYLVDLGFGAMTQFGTAGLKLSDLRAVFLTHLHSDHIADLSTLVLAGWGPPGLDSVACRVPVLGPGRAGGLPSARNDRDVAVESPDCPTPGTRDCLERILDAYAYDINIRMRDSGRASVHESFAGQDIDLPTGSSTFTGPYDLAVEPFPVYEDDRVRVTATLVDHRPVFPAFAFRFDTEHGSVVFSGDTAPSHNLIALAQRADILVHEAIDLSHYEARASEGDAGRARMAHLRESHTDVTEVGRVAERAGAAHLVLSHLAPGEGVTEEAWAERAAMGYSGRVTVGRELATIAVGVNPHSI